MSDPSAVPSALGIEAVEWIAEGGENLTVRVTGRWRRRRPAWSGKPTLVVEAPGRRYRFPAMPEPPSLTGTGPGMWRISFSVPAALAPELGGRSWLQFGSVAVPLPGAVEPPGALEAGEETGSASGSGWPAPSEVERSEVERHETAPLEVEPWPLAGQDEESVQQVHDLERDLAAARARADELAAELDAQHSDRRAAQQREHAERALRLDLTRRLNAHNREAERAREAYGELAAAEARVRELEAQLAAAGRRIDEAEQAAAAATIARQRAEETAARVRREAEQHVARLGAAEGARLAFEAGMEVRRAAEPERVPREPVVPPVPVPRRSAGAGPGFVAASLNPLAAGGSHVAPEPGVSALVAALRAEIDLRARSEAAMRGRLLDAEARLAAREHLARSTGETLGALRRELDGLGTALEAERGARLVAERRAADLGRALVTSRARSRDALTAISELREALAGLAPPGSPAMPEGPSAVEPERLNEALARLRERVAAPVSEPEAAEGSAAPAAPGTPTRDWLVPIFRELVRTDPDRAGRLLVDLLPAQGAVISEPIAYDLVLGGHENAVRVTAADGPVRIISGEPPRGASDVAFQVIGDHAALARMIVAGAFRRRFGRHVARIRGRRSQVAVLEALVGARLELSELHRLGVRLGLRSAVTVVAGVIDPALTAKESFTLAYAAPNGEAVYLLIREGARPEVTGVRPAGRITVTVTGAPGALEQVVTGEREPAATVTGEQWPLALLRKWLKSAQSA